MSVRRDTVRGRMHEAISSLTPFDEGDDENDEMPDSGVVVGWVIVAEWQGSDGHRWLSKLSGNATGDADLPEWTERGFCQEVVFNWSES